MVLWSAWLPDLLPHLPECPIPLVQHELKRAAKDFFARSRAWKVTLDPIAVAADTETVTVAPADAGQELVRVEQAWYDGKIIDLVTAEQAVSDFGDDWMDHVGTPTAYLQETPGVVRLYPIPDANASTGLKCRISVKPSEAATGIPDDQAVKYREALTTGAKSRLMLYRKKPWSDVEMGAALKIQFDSDIASANADAARSFGRGRIAAKPGWC